MKAEKNKKLNILYIIDELIQKGGTEHHLFGLAKEMIARGHFVAVICLSEGLFASYFRKIEKIEYHSLNIEKIYNVKGIFAFLFLVKYIFLKKFDIVQTFHTGSDLIGPLAAKLSLARPIVISSRRDAGYTKSPRHIMAQKIVNRLVDIVLANSHAVKSAVNKQELVPSDKIEIIYNGIDYDKFSHSEPRKASELFDKYKIPEDKLIVGSVGNVRHVKGYDLMVDVANLICPVFNNVHFVHVGGGPELGAIKNKCEKMKLNQSITFLGSQECVSELLSLMDIYIQPSRTEGFSNSILEAMAAGLPVIASRVGGNVEIIENEVTGFLVESEDVVAISEKIRFLMNDKHVRNSMGESGRKKVKETFALNVMLNRYEDFYYGTVEEGRFKQAW